mmetsp:Transcript_2090/g.5624  ORF Transcript_2090/g.5624 Transcript_2090/m.5624 type:complete len:366 (-) Transcript_2090:524-1621(-)
MQRPRALREHADEALPPVVARERKPLFAESRVAVIAAASLVALIAGCVVVLRASRPCADGADARSPLSLQNAQDTRADVLRSESRGTAAAVDQHGNSCELSLRMSDGFYCVSDQEWAVRTNIVRDQAPKQCSKKECCTFQRQHRSWYMLHFEPEWSCIKSRIGARGDGGKWMCDLHIIEERAKNRNSPCLIYSIGSNNDFRFEEAIHERLPDCEIFTFDPTVMSHNLSSSLPPFVQFRHWGLKGDDTFERGMQFYRLDTIMDKLGHTDREIDIFKIDIEGHEYKAFEGVFKRGYEKKIRSIQIELHKQRENGQLFLDLRRAGFLVYSKEPNFVAPAELHEVAFMRISSKYLEDMNDPLLEYNCSQ